MQQVLDQSKAAGSLRPCGTLQGDGALMPIVAPNGVSRSSGFTLIEVMAVMVIMGVLAAVAVKKVNVVSDSAETRMLEAGVAELNTRELMTWTNAKFAARGTVVDSGVWGAVNTDLGERYAWTAGPDVGGGTLAFGSVVAVLTRTASTEATAARWD